MSAHRLALRLAAIEALCPFATAALGPWPTLAQNRVFDSQQEPLSSLDPNDAKPICIVYTESDEGNPLGTAKFPIEDYVVKLTIECLIAARGTLQITHADGSIETIGTLTSPITDGAQEAALDWLEATVVRALSTTQDLISNRVWQAVVVEMHNINSVPLKGSDHTVRLLGRSVTMTCRVRPTVWPDLVVNATGTPVAATGFARLPDPLSLVAAMLDPASPGGLICASLAAAAPAAGAMIPMGGINVYGLLLNPPVPPQLPVTPLNANLTVMVP